MQKLFPSVSDAASTGPSSSTDTPEPAAPQQDGSNTPEPAATGPVRPFAWPPPEEDLDDWHVFQFDDAPSTPAPAAAPAPTSAAEPTVNLKPSQTPTLKIVSPFVEKTPAVTAPSSPSFATPATEPVVSPIIKAPAFATPDTAPIATPTTPSTPAPAKVVPFASPDTAPMTTPFATPATEPIVSPIIRSAPDASPEAFETPETTIIAAPAFTNEPTIGVTFSSPETEPGVVPLPPALATRAATPTQARSSTSTSTTITSLGLSGALHETGTALPARRVQTVAPVPVSSASDAALTSTTVEVIARSAHAARAPRSSWSWFGRTLVIGLALLATGEAAYIATMFLRKPAATVQSAALIIQSQPAGAEVSIDGQARGKTPLRLDLPPGQHLLELKKDGAVRKMPLVLAAGTQASQYIELHANEAGSAPAPAPVAPPSPRPAPAPTPSAADSRATAPAMNAAVPPGAGTVAGTAAGTAAAASTPPARPAPTVGWLVVQSPVTLSILRNGEAIGNSDDGRLAVGPGRHELELSNSAAGYREAMAIQIVAGRETVVQPELPQSTLDVESTPRARVSVDGRDVGETPLNQLALTIGPHEIVFRHPDFPERTVSTFIRVGTPAHVSVDLSNP